MGQFVYMPSNSDGTTYLAPPRWELTVTDIATDVVVYYGMVRPQLIDALLPTLVIARDITNEQGTRIIDAPNTGRRYFIDKHE